MRTKPYMCLRYLPGPNVFFLCKICTLSHIRSIEWEIPVMGPVLIVYYESGQSWALAVFLIFFTNKKWFFAFFVKLIWLGVGFLNRAGAEIGY